MNEKIVKASDSISNCLFLGLVAPSLLKKFGWRLVTIGGAVISTVGFGVSAITPNIYLLYFSYGCLTGRPICIFCFLFLQAVK